VGGVPAHVVFPPEWVIEADGRGSFRVECDCGWSDDGFDTASLARAAGFTHATSGAPPAPGGAAAQETPPTPPKRRWWRR
jgi:hypothetical protein